ncbi:MAG: hypothetical protein GDA46_03105 [Bdellovibrionales bacterium]|nr:hypothetical protein [Bdellovibrionales bacterium]
MNIALSFILFFSFLAESFLEKDFFEKKCTSEEIARTNKKFKTSEINLCMECQTKIPHECFLAMAIRGNRIFEAKQYKYCQKEESTSFKSNQKFCINNNYITALLQAFNDMSYCFQFNKEKREVMFHLMNHESGAILNVMSPTGASCLGQITEDYVKTINKIIKDSNSKHHNIWQEVSSRCPEVENFKIEDLNSMNCQSMLNPHKCLMYTFFGLRKSYKNIEERLNSEPGFEPRHMGNREFKSSDSFPSQGDLAKVKYENFLSLLPIDRKEMLTVKGRNIDGKKINWLIWDDSEIYLWYRKIDWSDETLEIQKVPLFEREEDIKTMFVYWSHNGGHSLSRDFFILSVKDLKQELAKICHEDSKEFRCKMRNQVQEGQGLSSVLAHEFFREDIFKNYPGNKARKNEVANYVSKIIESGDFIFNLEYDLSEILKSNEEGIENFIFQFQKDVSEFCPKRINF